MARERKGQGASWPGSESARVLLADSLRGANWPGSEKARYLEIQWTSVQEQTHLHLPLHFQLGLETIHCLYTHRCIIQHIPLWNNPEWKEYFFTSLLHRCLISFKEWPRVRRDISRWNISSREIADKPCAILKTSIRSARFRRSSNVQSLNWWSLSSYHKDRKPGNNLVNLCCTFSKSSLSFI